VETLSRFFFLEEKGLIYDIWDQGQIMCPMVYRARPGWYRARPDWDWRCGFVFWLLALLFFLSPV
jgi:hypothetical protein